MFEKLFNRVISWRSGVVLLQHKLDFMSKKSLPVSEIRQKYYSNISQEDFFKIASTDSISSNLQKDKLGKYAKWLLHLYQRKSLKLEDLYKAAEYITIFDKVAKMNKLTLLDLNGYKSLPEMYKAIKPYYKTNSNAEKSQKIKDTEAEKLYEDEAFMVVNPKTRKASILYGKGTQWCTAAKNNNQFRYYNKMGKLYIIIDKRYGKKYQFHAETKSYMDETDEEINWEFGSFSRKTCTLEKINATNGLFDYLISLFPNLYDEFLSYLRFNLLSCGGYTEIFKNAKFRILRLNDPKAWVSHQLEIEDWYCFCSQYSFDEKFYKMGDFYLLEDYNNQTSYILSENYSGFLEISMDDWLLDIGDSPLFFRKIDVDITPEMDNYLKKLKIHPDWEKYCDFFYNGQEYYIVKKKSHYALYNAHFEEIIGKMVSADQIYLTKTNQPVIVKGKYMGLYDTNDGTIRWGYKGAAEKEMHWIRDDMPTKILA